MQMKITEGTTASTKDLFENYFKLLKNHECEKYNYKNLVVLSGVIERDFVLYYKKGKEGFYGTEISICRYSGIVDTLQLVVSEKMLESPYQCGKYAEVFGIFESRNKGSHLFLRVLAYGISFYDDVEEENCNNIYLSGYICKKPIYRTTPLGRTITDVILAVNKKYRGCNYIPCIAWRIDATALKDVELGQKVSIYGRIQSREYEKILKDGDNEVIVQKTAYEVSINTLKLK